MEEMFPPGAAESGTGEGMPEVIVDFDYSRGLLFIVIENIGDAPAYDVTVNFDQKIKGVGGERIVSGLNVFKRLRFLPPSKKIRVFLDTFESYLDRKQPMVVKTTVSYQSKDDTKFSDSIYHDLSAYKGIIEA
jgi:hypothetical protein